MSLAAWAERNGVAQVTAYRWVRARLSPFPAHRVGWFILVSNPAAETSRRGQTAVYAWISSADRKSDLDRRVVQAKRALVATPAGDVEAA